MGFHCSEHMSLVFKRHNVYFDQVALKHSPPHHPGSTLGTVSNAITGGVVSSPDHAHHKQRKMSGDFLDSFEFKTGHGTCLEKASGGVVFGQLALRQCLFLVYNRRFSSAPKR